MCLIFLKITLIVCRDKKDTNETTQLFHLATLNQSCFYSKWKPIDHLELPSKNTRQFQF